MTAAAIIIVLIGVMVMAIMILVGSNKKLRQSANEAEREAYKAQLEAERLSILARKTEAVKHEQKQNTDAINTGDPAGDFAGSIDVLSKLSKKRADG